MPASPIIIRKSLVGLLLIYLAGGVLTVALALGAGYFYYDSTTPDLAAILAAVALVTILGTVVQAWIYQESRITITAESLDVVNWNSLTSQNNAVAEWNQVQDIDYQKSGVLPQLFNYGTLLVQTAGTERNLRITYVPKVEYWRDYIAKLADEATTPVTESPMS